MKTKGLSLIEIMVSIVILSLVVGAMFSVYPALFGGTDVSFQKIRAWEVARNQMEVLKTADFAILLIQAYRPWNQNPIPNSFNTTAQLPNSSGVYYVRRMRDKTSAILTDLLEVETVVCFRATNRTIGEDQNLNSILDANENDNTEGVNNPADNGDGRISSQINLRTLIRQQ